MNISLDIMKVRIHFHIFGQGYRAWLIASFNKCFVNRFNTIKADIYRYGNLTSKLIHLMLFCLQILATCAKNLLLLTYGTTLGISTIALPALDASRRPNATDPNLFLKTDSISLSKTEISWFSKYLTSVKYEIICAMCRLQHFFRSQFFYRGQVRWYSRSSVSAKFLYKKRIGTFSLKNKSNNIKYSP